MAKRPDEPESPTTARNAGTVSPNRTTGAAEGGAEAEGESWSKGMPGTHTAPEPHTGGSAEGSSDPLAEGEADHPDGEAMDSPEYRPRPDADKKQPEAPDSKHG